MKTPLALLSILLFALFSNPLLLRADDDLPDAVEDVAGQPLRRGVEYHILPAVRGQGGGLTLGGNRNGTRCPLDVVQERDENNNGFPVTFYPVDPQEGVIREQTDLNIVFSAASICVQTTQWQLGEFDESVGRAFVTTGGVIGHPGRDTLNNWFRIEEVDDDNNGRGDDDHDDQYKLVFCPSVCDICRPRCGDIGIFVDHDGTRRLALNGEPLRFRFRRV